MHLRTLLLAALLVPVLFLAGCIKSDAPFFADTPKATPLPPAFVLVADNDGKKDALRFDLEGDGYATTEKDRKTVYGLTALPGDDARELFVAMETRIGRLMPIMASSNMPATNWCSMILTPTNWPGRWG